MPCPHGFRSLAWSQGSAHPLRSVHYTLFFQATLGVIVFVLVSYSIANMGWWTNLNLAAGLALAASFLTICFALLLQLTMAYMRPTDTTWSKRTKTAAGALLALAAVCFNSVAGIVMFTKPGKDFRHSFDKGPPVGEWWTATTLLFIQLLISGWCAFKILKFSLDGQRPVENLSDSELENYPIGSTASSHGAIGMPSPSPAPSGDIENQSNPIQASPAQLQSRLWYSPFRKHHEPMDDTPDDNTGESSSRPNRMSANARGKQREALDDGANALALGLAGVDAGGKAWTPV